MRSRPTTVIFVAAIAISGCTIGPRIAETANSPPADELAQPTVVMEAVPPPPFTYWAPVGSTIRNHPRQSGVWIAEVDGQAQRYYFGDQCHASRYQKFIGQPVEALPSRLACHLLDMRSDVRPWLGSDERFL